MNQILHRDARNLLRSFWFRVSLIVIFLDIVEKILFLHTTFKQVYLQQGLNFAKREQKYVTLSNFLNVLSEDNIFAALRSLEQVVFVY